MLAGLAANPKSTTPWVIAALLSCMALSFGAGGTIAAVGPAAKPHWQLIETALQPQFVTFTQEDGLPGNAITALAEDAHGALWVATNQGVARFDGRQFHAMQPPGRAMPLIADTVVTTAHGDVWIGGSEEGIWRYRMRDQSWRSYQKADGSLSSNDIWSMGLDPSGTLWAGGYLGGVVGISAAGIRRMPGIAQDMSVLELFVDGGAVWVANLNAEIWRWDPGRDARLCATLPAPVVTLARSDGMLIAHGSTGQVFGFSDCAEPKLLHRSASPTELSTVQLDGGSWVGFGHGIGRRIAGGYHVYRYRFGVRGSLPEGRVNALIKDRNGGLWIGTPTGLALLRASYRRALLWPYDPLDPSMLNRSPPSAIGESGGALWSGARGAGMVRLLDERSRRWPLLPDPAGNVLTPRGFLAHEGKLWIGTNRGLQQAEMVGTELNGLRQVPTTASWIVHGIVPWDTGVLVGVQAQGLMLLAADETIQKQEFGAALPGQELIDLRREGDEIWLASDAGLYRSKLQWPPQWERLTSRRVRAWCQDQDGVHAWLYLPGRIEKLRRADGRMLWWRTSGVPAHDHGHIACGRQSIWLFASGQGHEFTDKGTGVVRSFGSRDGLGGTVLMSARQALSDADSVWLSATAGMVRFRLDGDGLPQDVPLVVEDGGVHRSREQPAEIHRPSGRAEIRSSDVQSIWQIRVVTMADPQRGEFRWQSDTGLSREWQSLERAEIPLSAFHPGQHRIRVEARHPDHAMVSAPLLLELHVWPPWYRSDVAQSAYLILLSLLAWWLLSRWRTVRNRYRRVHDRMLQADFGSQRSQQRAQILHHASHELRNLHAGIRGVAQLLIHQALPERAERQARRLLAATDDLGALLEDLLESARLDRGALSLDAQPFSVSECLRTETTTYQQWAQARGLTFEIRCTGLHDWRLGDVLRLKQVAVNLIGNAVRYCEEGGVLIHAECHDPRMLSIAVHDTGPGIAPHLQARVFEPFALPRRAKDSTGLGLSLCKQWVERLGGELRYQPLERGSCFRISVPFPALAQTQRTR